MSVWPLSTTEGQLLSVSIRVEPSELESLLEALAQVSFPINPQIYHDAAVVYCYPDDREETQATTLVEFPAFEAHISEVRSALASHNFAPDSLISLPMLDEIKSDIHPEPTPTGADYISSYRTKHRAAVA